MNTEIENIIINHNFAELSAEQKIMVNEWAASEEEFVTMKQIIASAPLLDANVAPSPKLKASLMDTFATTYSSGVAMASGGPIVQKKGNNKKVIYMWFRTGAAVAAVVLAVFLVYPLFNSDDTANLVAENKVTNKDQTKSPVKAKETRKKVKANAKAATPNSQQEVGYLADVIAPSPVSEMQVAPTNGPNDGGALASADEVLRIEVDDFVLEMPDLASEMSFTAPATTITSFSNANGFINTNSGDAYTFGKTDMDSHSDRLATADLPEHTRPIIQDRPELLDLLHTSF